MADYNLVCINCFHSSHLDKPCPYCPQPTKENPNARCTQFVRADIFVSRSLARIEESVAGTHGQLMAGLSTIFDLMCEVWPEASDRLQEKLKKRQEESEARMKEEQAKRLAEAEAAYANASKQDMTEELAEKYSKPGYEPPTNLIKFPTKERSNDITEPDPDFTPDDPIAL